VEVEGDRRTGRGGTAGWPNRGPGLRGCLPLPGRRVRVRLPGPWLSQVVSWVPFFARFFQFWFVTFYTSWSRIENIIAQSHTTKLSRRKKGVYNMKLGGESTVMTVLGFPDSKQLLIHSQFFFSFKCIEESLPRSKDVLESGSPCHERAGIFCAGSCQDTRPVTQLLLTVLRRTISMDVDILVCTLRSFLVWKSLLYTVLPYYRKRHSFVCSFLPSDRAHANPLRQRAQATTATSTGNGKFSCRWCASAAGRVRRKRRARCATRPTPFAWLRSAPPQARHPTVQGFRPVRSGAMHFACLTRTF